MKVKEDTLPHAKAVLTELLSLQQSIAAMADALHPYDAEAKKEHKTVPHFLVARRAALTAASVTGFTMNYPHINDMVKDGMNEDSGMFRLHDGIYKLGQLMQRLQGCKCMVKTDDECNELRDMANKALADFVIFVITQYKLSSYDELVLISVTEYCEAEGISASVFYGSQLSLLERTGETVYGYESISPYRDDLLDMDVTFVAECEECNFPLTEDICKGLISGDLTLATARGQLQSWMEQMEQREVEGLTLSNMVQRMSLE